MWTPEKCMVQTRALWRKVEPQWVRQEVCPTCESEMLTTVEYLCLRGEDIMETDVERTTRALQ